MRTHRRVLAFAGVGALLASLAGGDEAGAQTLGGWALNRYEPTPTGDVFFMTEHPWYSRVRTLAVGLTVDYAASPLTVHIENPGQPVDEHAVISGMLTGHLGASVAFLDRIGIHLSLPVAFTQSGTATNALGGVLAPATGVAIGDVRAGVRVRLVGDADRDAFSLHLGANVWVPTGGRDDNTGDGKVRVEPRLTLAGRASSLRWSLGAGFHYRSDLNAGNLAVGSELRVSAGIGVALLNNRLHVGPEGYLFTSLRDLPTGGSAVFAQNEWGAEVILGARYLIADAIQIGAGGGLGIERGYGIPAGRALFTVAYAPVRPEAPARVDTDGDGVIDPEDVCPAVPMGPTPDPARRGCPAQDTDSDGVFDPEDQCPTEPMGATPDPARRGCPTGDRDRDGVLDPEDQCPDQAQGEVPDPARRGCPAGDRDGDGVFDPNDQCVDVPAGPRPSTARQGCPAPDADNDNIIDQPEGPDRCPTQPETFNGVTDDDGCPDGETLAVTSGSFIQILQQVNFRTDRDEIQGARSFRVLDSVVAVLRSAVQLRVDVQGHTDDRGDPAHNRDLSQRRALSVVRYLTEHGLDPSRVMGHGFGPDCPLQPGRSRAARAANRRVQFLIVTADHPAGQCFTGTAATPAPATPAAPVAVPPATPAPAPVVPQ